MESKSQLPFHSMSGTEGEFSDFQECPKKDNIDRKMKRKLCICGSFIIITSFALGMVTGHFAIGKKNIFGQIVENFL